PAPEPAQPAVAAAPADLPAADAKVPTDSVEAAGTPALTDPAQALPPATVDQQAAPAAPVAPAPTVISTSTSS
ncbi:chemotaxis protein CheA, partial [Burkholderia cenocepacia]|nr:chemotaxis protein CheA [Burkholderia cenocepacia]